MQNRANQDLKDQDNKDFQLFLSLLAVYVPESYRRITDGLKENPDVKPLVISELKKLCPLSRNNFDTDNEYQDYLDDTLNNAGEEEYQNRIKKITTTSYTPIKRGLSEAIATLENTFDQIPENQDKESAQKALNDIQDVLLNAWDFGLVRDINIANKNTQEAIKHFLGLLIKVDNHLRGNAFAKEANGQYTEAALGANPLPANQARHGYNVFHTNFLKYFERVTSRKYNENSPISELNSLCPTQEVTVNAAGARRVFAEINIQQLNGNNATKLQVITILRAIYNNTRAAGDVELNPNSAYIISQLLHDVLGTDKINNIHGVSTLFRHVDAQEGRDELKNAIDANGGINKIIQYIEDNYDNLRQKAQINHKLSFVDECVTYNKIDEEDIKKMIDPDYIIANNVDAADRQNARTHDDAAREETKVIANAIYSAINKPSTITVDEINQYLTIRRVVPAVLNDIKKRMSEAIKQSGVTSKDIMRNIKLAAITYRVANDMAVGPGLPGVQGLHIQLIGMTPPYHDRNNNCTAIATLISNNLNVQRSLGVANIPNEVAISDFLQDHNNAIPVANRVAIKQALVFNSLDKGERKVQCIKDILDHLLNGRPFDGVNGNPVALVPVSAQLIADLLSHDDVLNVANNNGARAVAGAAVGGLLPGAVAAIDIQNAITNVLVLNVNQITTLRQLITRACGIDEVVRKAITRADAVDMGNVNNDIKNAIDRSVCRVITGVEKIYSEVGVPLINAKQIFDAKKFQGQKITIPADTIPGNTQRAINHTQINTKAIIQNAQGKITNVMDVVDDAVDIQDINDIDDAPAYNQNIGLGAKHNVNNTIGTLSAAVNNNHYELDNAGHNNYTYQVNHGHNVLFKKSLKDEYSEIKRIIHDIKQRINTFNANSSDANYTEIRNACGHYNGVADTSFVIHVPGNNPPFSAHKNLLELQKRLKNMDVPAGDRYDNLRKKISDLKDNLDYLCNPRDLEDVNRQNIDPNYFKLKAFNNAKSAQKDVKNLAIRIHSFENQLDSLFRSLILRDKLVGVNLDNKTDDQIDDILSALSKEFQDSEKMVNHFDVLNKVKEGRINNVPRYEVITEAKNISNLVAGKMSFSKQIELLGQFKAICEDQNIYMQLTARDKVKKILSKIGAESNIEQQIEIKNYVFNPQYNVALAEMYLRPRNKSILDYAKILHAGIVFMEENVPDAEKFLEEVVKATGARITKELEKIKTSKKRRDLTKWILTVLTIVLFFVAIVILAIGSNKSRLIGSTPSADELMKKLHEAQNEVGKAFKKLDGADAATKIDLKPLSTTESTTKSTFSSLGEDNSINTEREYTTAVAESNHQALDKIHDLSFDSQEFKDLSKNLKDFLKIRAKFHKQALGALGIIQRDYYQARAEKLVEIANAKDSKKIEKLTTELAELEKKFKENFHTISKYIYDPQGSYKDPEGSNILENQGGMETVSNIKVDKELFKEGDVGYEHFPNNREFWFKMAYQIDATNQDKNVQSLQERLIEAYALGDKGTVTKLIEEIEKNPLYTSYIDSIAAKINIFNTFFEADEAAQRIYYFLKESNIDVDQFKTMKEIDIDKTLKTKVMSYFDPKTRPALTSNIMRDMLYIMYGKESKISIDTAFNNMKSSVEELDYLLKALEYDRKIVYDTINIPLKSIINELGATEANMGQIRNILIASGISKDKIYDILDHDSIAKTIHAEYPDDLKTLTDVQNNEAKKSMLDTIWSLGSTKNLAKNDKSTFYLSWIKTIYGTAKGPEDEELKNLLGINQEALTKARESIESQIDKSFFTKYYSLRGQVDLAYNTDNKAFKDSIKQTIDRINEVYEILRNTKDDNELKQTKIYNKFAEWKLTRAEASKILSFTQGNPTIKAISHAVTVEIERNLLGGVISDDMKEFLKQNNLNSQDTGITIIAQNKVIDDILKSDLTDQQKAFRIFAFANDQKLLKDDGSIDTTKVKVKISEEVGVQEALDFYKNSNLKQVLTDNTEEVSQTLIETIKKTLFKNQIDNAIGDNKAKAQYAVNLLSALGIDQKDWAKYVSGDVLTEVKNIINGKKHLASLLGSDSSVLSGQLNSATTESAIKTVGDKIIARILISDAGIKGNVKLTDEQIGKINDILKACGLDGKSFNELQGVLPSNLDETKFNSFKFNYAGWLNIKPKPSNPPSYLDGLYTELEAFAKNNKINGDVIELKRKITTTMLMQELQKNPKFQSSAIQQKIAFNFLKGTYQDKFDKPSTQWNPEDMNFAEKIINNNDLFNKVKAFSELQQVQGSGMSLSPSDQELSGIKWGDKLEERISASNNYGSNPQSHVGFESQYNAKKSFSITTNAFTKELAEYNTEVNKYVDQNAIDELSKDNQWDKKINEITDQFKLENEDKIKSNNIKEVQPTSSINSITDNTVDSEKRKIALLYLDFLDQRDYSKETVGTNKESIILNIFKRDTTGGIPMEENIYQHISNLPEEKKKFGTYLIEKIQNDNTISANEKNIQIRSIMNVYGLERGDLPQGVKIPEITVEPWPVKNQLTEAEYNKILEMFTDYKENPERTNLYRDSRINFGFGALSAVVWIAGLCYMYKNQKNDKLLLGDNPQDKVKKMEEEMRKKLEGQTSEGKTKIMKEEYKKLCDGINYFFDYKKPDSNINHQVLKKKMMKNAREWMIRIYKDSVKIDDIGEEIKHCANRVPYACRRLLKPTDDKYIKALGLEDRLKEIYKEKIHQNQHQVRQ